jgi:hypothetical protein
MNLTKPVRKAEAAVNVSYKITEIMAKNKQPSADSNMIRECFVVTGDSLLD